MPNSVFLWPNGFTTSGGTVTINNGTFTGQALFADGTGSLPSIAFASQPNTGIYHAAANDVSIVSNGQRNFAFAGADMYLLGTTPTIRFGASSDTIFGRIQQGQFTIAGTGNVIGSVLKVDALPTISIGFGTSPAVVAGSTAFAGAVNVGTGGVATTGTVTWNGTAFPTTPFCVATGNGGAGVQTLTPGTTQLQFTTSVAWPASTVVSWICVSSK